MGDEKTGECHDPYDFVNWGTGTLLVDIFHPHRRCVVTRSEDIKERPRIGVLYDDGEKLECTHPNNYRRLVIPDIKKLVSRKTLRRMSVKHKILFLVSRGIQNLGLIDLLVNCDHVDIEVLLEQLMVRMKGEELRITILGGKMLARLDSGKDTSCFSDPL